MTAPPADREPCVAAQIQGAREVVRYLTWAKTSSDAATTHIIELSEDCARLWSPDYAAIAACLKSRAAISPP